MIVLMVILALFFSLLLSILSIFGEYYRTSNILFISGIIAPALIFYYHIPKKPFSLIMGGWSNVSGIEVVVDGYNFYLILAELIVFLLVGLYAVHYFVDKKRTRFFILMLLMHAGLLGGFMSRDLFNYFVLMEVAYVSTFIMVAISKGKEATRAAFRYLIFSFMASYLFLLSIGLIYINTGSLNVEIISETITLNSQTKIAIGLAFASLLMKAGIFPLFFWLPDAHSIPNTPVSAVLSGISLKGPIYGMILFVVYFPMEFLSNILLYLAFASVFLGVIMGLRQTNIKRLLAYSTVSQMGYVLVGIATANVFGAIYYGITHALIKSGLFLAAGTLVDRHGTTDMRTLSYKDNKPIMIAIMVLSLAIVGISPTLGAYAKKELMGNIFGVWPLILTCGSIGTMVLMLKMNYYLWIGEGSKTALLPKKDYRFDVVWITKSFIPLASAILVLAYGYLFMPRFHYQDIIVIGIGFFIFLPLKKFDLFHWRLPRFINDLRYDLGSTNNYLFMVYVAVVLLLIIP
ncbi:MAG: proton-conducting transporter membrane subunit [Thermoplasmata archaeon]